MKKIDFKSLIIGVLATTLLFITVGAKSQVDNLGDIVVNSITVKNNGEGGYIALLNTANELVGALGGDDIGGAHLQLFNAKGAQTAFVGSAVDQSGLIQTNHIDGTISNYIGGGTFKTYNFDLRGIETGYFGTGIDGSGAIKTYNAKGEITGFFGTGKYNEGWAFLYNNQGDISWAKGMNLIDDNE